MKILFASSEAVPFIKSGGLADVAGSLSSALRKRAQACRVVLPLYEDIPQEYREKMKFLTFFNVPLGWRNQYCGVFESTVGGVKHYFLDNEYYFKRHGLYGFFDDGERFAFFSKSIFEILPLIDFVPDVIHSNDWQTALVPIYFNIYFGKIEKYSKIKNVFTIHNIEYQGKYSLDIMEDIFDISRQFISIVEFEGFLNLMKGAIVCANVISTVSNTYAQEILEPYFSHGLFGILRENSSKIKGILNGIDEDFYNPETDKCLFKNYSSDNLSGKDTCKAELQKYFDLPVSNEIPVIVMITRLVSHKGLDLVKGAIEDILKCNVQFIILGKGDALFENYFLDMQKIYSQKMRTIIAYDADLSRKLYSGADMFLMPSRSEPCGLAQMIASRYGTVPIVRETGGLFDSIKDIGNSGGGNGFTFSNYRAVDMLNRIYCAIEMFTDRKEWEKLVKKVMNVDFSWKASAKQYVKMYRTMHNA